MLQHKADLAYVISLPDSRQRTIRGTYCAFDMTAMAGGRRSLKYKQMERACWGKEDTSGSGARLLQWSQLSVLAVPVIALTTDITLTRRAHAEKKA